MNNKDIYHKIYDENGNIDSMDHYVHAIKTHEYIYLPRSIGFYYSKVGKEKYKDRHSYGFVATEKRSDETHDLIKPPQREPKQQYLWKNLSMPEPKPTEVIEFGAWDALKSLYYVGATIALVRGIVDLTSQL